MATLWYLRGYDGWGAWAAAPLLLPSFVLSAVWGCAGLVLSGRSLVRTRQLDVPLLLATVVSGVPALYYTLRAWV
jgi:hypothetical protein